jgi:hypothetical protein
MKTLLLKTLSLFTGASKYVLEFIIPILKDSTSNILKEILPIAVEVVSSLSDSSKSGDQKRRLAINQIKKAALNEGIDASSRVVNLAIELALAKISK